MDYDSDATIIDEPETVSVDDILKKYGIIQGSNPPQTSTNVETQVKNPRKVYDLSDSESDHDVPIDNSQAHVDSQVKNPRKVYELSDSDSDHNVAQVDDILVSKPPVKRKTTSPKPARSQKVDDESKALKAAERAKKKEEADLKKAEAQKNKEIKKILNNVQKCLKPEECIKFITAIVDENLAQKYSTDFVPALTELGCEYRTQSQLIPNTITWIRKVESHLMDEQAKGLKTSTSIEEVPDLLLILTANELFEFISNNNLLAHIKTLQSVYENKHVSLGILSLEKELKVIKNNKKFSLSRVDVMTVLTEVEVFCNCCHRDLQTSADLTAMLCQFTKAIAQRPYKLQQKEKDSLTSWYVKGDNKDCVKVDKKGNGLKRLWQQQLTSFPLVRLETAESIIENYPTVNSLITAYDNSEQKETLLADIAIRRHAGSTSSSRRIGNELSRKIQVFYNSLDGDTTLS